MNDALVQRLEGERLQPAPELDPAGEALGNLIRILADAARQAGWY
jgi:hypothetical protein